MTRYICRVILAVKRKIVLSADMSIAQVASYKVYRLSEVEWVQNMNHSAQVAVSRRWITICTDRRREKYSVSRSTAQTPLTHQPTQCELCVHEFCNFVNPLYYCSNINIKDEVMFHLINWIFCCPSCIWDHLLLCPTFLDQLKDFSACRPHFSSLQCRHFFTRPIADLGSSWQPARAGLCSKGATLSSRWDSQWIVSCYLRDRVVAGFELPDGLGECRVVPGLGAAPKCRY